MSINAVNGSDELVIATGNAHKVEEMRAIFAAIAAEMGVTPARLPKFIGLESCGVSIQTPAEVGKTFEENARIKAIDYAQQTGRPCLSDDSGLEVNGLNGAPGVISSHFCTDGEERGMSRSERDEANNRRLLLDLSELPTDQRNARFVCVMALAGSSAEPILTKGTMEGRIGLSPRVPAGNNGFGYDPLFLVAPDYQSTSAELTAREKNRVSHRQAAARQMISYLLRRKPI